MNLQKKGCKKLVVEKEQKLHLLLRLHKNPNTLVLDEPTNHLDILNKDYLQKVLEGYIGTILIISHDWEFLKSTTNKIFEIKDKTILQKDFI